MDVVVPLATEKTKEFHKFAKHNFPEIQHLVTKRGTSTKTVCSICDSKHAVEEPSWPDMRIWLAPDGGAICDEILSLEESAGQAAVTLVQIKLSRTSDSTLIMTDVLMKFASNFAENLLPQIPYVNGALLVSMRSFDVLVLLF